ncbi:TATA box-binding protein-associated factor [Cavenderia fasciculata]|uniref:TATA box-binding protein-associated factor n=1 Tax=Cavenderia fasciculata TaxID=261658 RepID=F4PW02_CACFS|nr:TATA box-binding protein-associated factor [Cavenderia fasciculata]EGG20166.1 TATA box-binding protein-associated factor [Cavenderia fasciculata]|eukprot:XP_004367149.1 TATA box-binding protein-associated factor [Cavenderia fasciculata]
MAKACPHCGCTVFDTSHDGTFCTGCSRVIDGSNIVSELQFSETSGLMGTFVNARGQVGRGSYRSLGGESRALSTENARRRMHTIAGQVGLKDVHIDMGVRLYETAMDFKFTKGRSTQIVSATCLYTVCRRELTPHLLIDFSEAIQLNVFVLASTFLKFIQTLGFQLPLVDPALFIQRFAVGLEFEQKTQEVANTALKLVARMKRDWMSIGRRPSGICGASLFIAAKIHGFKRTVKEIVQVVKIGEDTIIKRLKEFKDTPSAALTIDEFDAIDVETEHDPPSFIKNRLKEIDAEQKIKLQQAKDEEKRMEWSTRDTLFDLDLETYDTKAKEDLKKGLELIKGKDTEDEDDEEEEEEEEEEEVKEKTKGKRKKKVQKEKPKKKKKKTRAEEEEEKEELEKQKELEEKEKEDGDKEEKEDGDKEKESSEKKDGDEEISGTIEPSQDKDKEKDKEEKVEKELPTIEEEDEEEEEKEKSKPKKKVAKKVAKMKATKKDVNNNNNTIIIDPIEDDISNVLKENNLENVSIHNLSQIPTTLSQSYLKMLQERAREDYDMNAPLPGLDEVIDDYPVLEGTTSTQPEQPINPEVFEPTATLDDLEDDELDLYIERNQSVRNAKELIWTELNKEWIEKNAAREKEEEEARAMGRPIRKRAKKQTAASAAEAMAEALRKRVKDQRIQNLINNLVGVPEPKQEEARPRMQQKKPTPAANDQDDEDEEEEDDDDDGPEKQPASMASLLGQQQYNEYDDYEDYY